MNITLVRLNRDLCLFDKRREARKQIGWGVFWFLIFGLTACSIAKLLTGN